MDEKPELWSEETVGEILRKHGVSPEDHPDLVKELLGWAGDFADIAASAAIGSMY